jgi:putative effector of murein hydrolase
MSDTTIIFLGFTATLAAYVFGGFCQKMSRNHILVNPAIIAIGILVAILHYAQIDYQQYMKGAGIISLFLSISTIALAIPLYKHKNMVYNNLLPIIISVVVSCCITIYMAYYISDYFGANESIKKAIILKSVTTPIAVLVSDKIHAIPSLTIMFIFTTGIFGAVLGIPLLRLFNFKDDALTGLSLGVICHGLGVARAFQVSEIAGLFAMIGMTLMGIVSAIIIPLLIVYL